MSQSKIKAFSDLQSLRACAIHNPHWKDYQRAYFSKKKSEPKGRQGGMNKETEPKIGENVLVD